MWDHGPSSATSLPGFCHMDGVPDDVGGGRFPPDGRAWLSSTASRWKDEPKLRKEKGREGTGIIPSAWSPGSMSSFHPSSGVCAVIREPVGMLGSPEPRRPLSRRTANDIDRGGYIGRPAGDKAQ